MTKNNCNLQTGEQNCILLRDRLHQVLQSGSYYEICNGVECQKWSCSEVWDFSKLNSFQRKNKIYPYLTSNLAIQWDPIYHQTPNWTFQPVRRLTFLPILLMVINIYITYTVVEIIINVIILYDNMDFANAKSQFLPNPMLKEGLTHYKEWISDHLFTDLLS